MKTNKSIVSKINDLQTEPEKRGKPMKEDLKGYYSVRAAGQRYRVIYETQVLELEPTAPQKGKQQTKDSSPVVDRVVTVVVVGIRKEGSKSDAYQIARKRLSKK